MAQEIHVFDNGVQVYVSQLMPAQIQRYQNVRNVHEADEEDLFVEVLRSSPRIECIVDVGSAIGYYPLLAKRILPDVTIHAYEPLDIFRQYFTDNIRLNGFAPQQFHVHSECVSSTRGRTYFVEATYGSKVLRGKALGTSVFFAKLLLKRLLTRRGNYPLPKISSLNTITLDDVATNVGCPIDYLQMDVQGHEFEILQGGAASLRAGKIKSFMIGTHSSKLHRQCAQYLVEYGYEIEVDEEAAAHQPDGIILASKGVQRHGARPG